MTKARAHLGEGSIRYVPGDSPGPRFLTVEEVLYLHRRLIEDMGGEPGLLNPGALESAVAQPAMTAFGQLLHPTLIDQAAAYLFHLVANHPFCDGNKRIGMHATLIFIDTNHGDVLGSPDDWYELTIAVARSELSKRDLTKKISLFVK